MRGTGRTDLFELAEKNAAPLKSRFEELKARKPVDEAAQIDRFAVRVLEDGRISVNMRTSVLSHILLGRKHQNIHEWAQEQSQVSERSVNEILREKLHENHDARLAFDDSFEQGRKSRYGCLNIGGAGAAGFGQFCCVLKSPFPGRRGRIAYLRSDSLGTYLSTDTKVNAQALSRNVAPHRSRHHLAALKHSDEILGADEKNWPGIICSDADYIEAIFTGAVRKRELGEVRVPHKEYSRLRDLAFSDFGKPQDEANRSLIDDFATIRRETQGGDIEFKVIDDA